MLRVALIVKRSNEIDSGQNLLKIQIIGHVEWIIGDGQLRELTMQSPNPNFDARVASRRCDVSRSSLVRPTNASSVYSSCFIAGTLYETRPQPIDCPTPQERCPLADFLEFLTPRQEKNCCVRGQAFFDFGCGDFLNADVLLIPQCMLKCFSNQNSVVRQNDN